MTEAGFETAWAAGLFDGEGSASSDPSGRARLQLKMVDEATVRRFARAVLLGKTYGPYRNRMGERDGYERSDFFVWVASGREACEVAAALRPWLSDVRRTSIDSMLAEDARRAA